MNIIETIITNKDSIFAIIVMLILILAIANLMTITNVQKRLEEIAKRLDEIQKNQSPKE